MSVESTTTKSWCLQVPVHYRFQEWRQDRVFKRMGIDGLKIHDKKVGINWKWQSYNIKCKYMNPLIRMRPVGCETNLA